MSAPSKMMEACGEAEGRLATELMQYEVQVERDILDPLNQLAEVGNTKDSPFSVCLLSEDRLSVTLASHRLRSQTY